jgi:hypothetical protein
MDANELNFIRVDSRPLAGEHLLFFVPSRGSILPRSGFTPSHDSGGQGGEGSQEPFP